MNRHWEVAKLLIRDCWVDPDAGNPDKNGYSILGMNTFLRIISIMMNRENSFPECHCIRLKYYCACFNKLSKWQVPAETHSLETAAFLGQKSSGSRLCINSRLSTMNTMKLTILGLALVATCAATYGNDAAKEGGVGSKCCANTTCPNDLVCLKARKCDLLDQTKCPALVAPTGDESGACHRKQVEDGCKCGPELPFVRCTRYQSRCDHGVCVAVCPKQ